MEILSYIQEFVSCGHRYARKDWSREKNLEVYGGDYSEEGVGHNLGILACGTGEVQAPLKALCETLDHRFLNEIMGDVVPTAEAIARYCFENIKAPDLRFVRVQQGDHLWAGYFGPSGASLTKLYQLSCLHRHHNPDLSDVENEELYGKCSQVHGHEYGIEVTLRGSVHSETHLVCHRQWMDDWVHRLLIQPFHGRLLNDLIGNASGELITQKFYNTLKPHLPEGFQLGLCLRETRKNSFFTRGAVF